MTSAHGEATTQMDAPEKIAFERDYPGDPSQARHVRADLAHVASECPAADDLILLASELAANAATHSKSGQADGPDLAHIRGFEGCASR